MAKKRRRRRPEPPRPSPPARGRGEPEPVPSPAPSPPRRRIGRRGLIAVLAAAAAIALAASGLVRVREGEVAAVGTAGGPAAAVWQEGWHWRLPGRGAVRRLPSRPIALAGDVEVRTAEGAAITLEVAGRFAVDGGRGARAWIETAGWSPFADALLALAAERLGGAVRDVDHPAALFSAEAEERLAAALRRELEAAGAGVEALAVRAPPQRNPVALAAIRGRVAALARPTGRKVLLVGWDGADWLMIRPLLAAGRLPNLERLIERGVSGELRSQEPLLSPLVWTSIATGKTVPEHGVADFLVRDPGSGELVPISSSSRKVHALWTILPAFDLTTDVVAWWATWPAEPTRGTLVSDRVAYQLFDVADAPGRGKVHPPEAWDWVEEKLVPAERVGIDEVRRFVDVDPAEVERRWASLPPDRRQEDRINHLRKVLATTRSYHAIALELIREQADLTMVYYEGTDTVGHLFARYLPPAMPGVSAGEVRRFGDALPEFYAYADELLGELLAAASPDTTVILVSDHGFFTGEARPAIDPADFTMGAPQWHRLYGVIVGAGPGVRPGRVDGATIFDVAPTVLALLGLPVPPDLRGRVLPELLPAGLEPIRSAADRLASFEELPRARPEEGTRLASEMDEERLRELVALGYISPQVLEGRRGRGGGAAGDAAVGAAGESAAAAAAGSDLEAMATEAYNLGRIAQRQGDLATARRHFETAVERLPSFAHGWAGMAQVAALSGDHCEAFELLVRGFARSREMPMSALTGLVDEGGECGRLDEAGRVLERVRPDYGERSGFHAARGLLESARGRPEAALEHYRRALAIDPLDQLANEETVAILRRLGREAEARRFLDQAFDSARGDMAAMNQLAVVALRQGWPAEAERLLRRVLESDPGNPGVLANLAATQLQQGRSEEAAATMREAIRRDPDNARNHYNLGAMLAEQGRFAEALRAFETATAKGLVNPQVHIAAAKMRFRLGDRAGSARDLEKALALDPANREAREMLNALETG